MIQRFCIENRYFQPFFLFPGLIQFEFKQRRSPWPCHEQNKGHIKIISFFYSLHIFPLFFVLGNLVFSYALGISRNILPKAISKVIETINFRKTKIFGNER